MCCKGVCCVLLRKVQQRVKIGTSGQLTIGNMIYSYCTYILTLCCFCMKTLMCGDMSPVIFQIFIYKMRFLCIRIIRVLFILFYSVSRKKSVMHCACTCLGRSSSLKTHLCFLHLQLQVQMVSLGPARWLHFRC